MGRVGFDVIVVGARCAGSPMAMLLARKGYRVLLLDRAEFPSDTLSTHLLHPPGVTALRRWGLLERVVASGCPPIHTYSYDFGTHIVSGAPGREAEPVAYAPRRHVLDHLLVEAAARAGAEVRTGFTVAAILVDADGRVTGVRGRTRTGPEVTEHATVVVGADGQRSTVAAAVSARRYNERPRAMCGYYRYYSGLEMDGVFEAYTRPWRGFAAAPTHDGLTMVVSGWPFAEMHARRADLEGNYLAGFEQAPHFAERLRAARPETRLLGTSLPGFFRKPFGPGWALVGDAGYTRDFITAQGISDAFATAQWCAEALDDTFTDRRPFDTAMAGYQVLRDRRALRIYDFTADLATLAPPEPDFLRLLDTVSGDPAAMRDFVQVNSGLLAADEFFLRYGSMAPAR
ncbi:NAD(P)/FAD-dependent oxidoreductase [Nocardia sp. AG03]|uniref:NAD(P)/FAD-dependent oxidoreductase n=1 Tax=Nocardia sp. AG03 TaxID=3025312 RepID=UPI00241830AC|nr:NAD(P)/FAD-dependent oxidoreductase [Nocardia sp. AG03]